MPKTKAATLVEDLDLWPRSSISGANVASLAAALEAGAKLPPVKVDKASRRVVDGFHRRRAHIKAFGDDANIEVVYKTYGSEAELFEDAVRLNSEHGLPLTQYDHARIALRGKQLKIPTTKVAVLIHRTPEYVEKRKFGVRVLSNGAREAIPLKRSMGVLEGHELTDDQLAANDNASGWNLGYHVDQVIKLLQAGVTVTPETREKLEELKSLI